MSRWLVLRRPEGKVTFIPMAILFAGAALMVAGAHRPYAFEPVLTSIDAHSSGDLYIGFAMPSGPAEIRRLSADALQYGHWTFGTSAGQIDDPVLVAASSDGVFAAMVGDSPVAAFGYDGIERPGWNAGGALLSLSSPVGESGGGRLYTLASETASRRVVGLWSDAGRSVNEWPVDVSAYDLAAGPHEDAHGGVVVVAEGNWIRRYRADGSEFGAWNLAQASVAIDMDRDGFTWVALPAVGMNGAAVQSISPQGVFGPRCLLPGDTDPVDLTVSPNTHLYVIVRRPDEPSRPYAVVRMRRDCSVLTTWELDQLLGLAPVPTPVTTAVVLPSSEPPTATPTATATPTGPLPDLLLPDGRVCEVREGGPNDGLFVDLWVLNMGPMAAGTFRVGETDQERPEWRVPGLAAGAQERLERRRVTGQVLRVVADSDGEIAESDETNNEWRTTPPSVPPGVTATLPPPPTCPVETETPTPVPTETPTAEHTVRLPAVFANQGR